MPGTFVLTVFGNLSLPVNENVVNYLVLEFPERSTEKLSDTLTRGKRVIIRRLSRDDAVRLSENITGFGAVTRVTRSS